MNDRYVMEVILPRPWQAQELALETILSWSYRHRAQRSVPRATGSLGGGSCEWRHGMSGMGGLRNRSCRGIVRTKRCN